MAKFLVLTKQTMYMSKVLEAPTEADAKQQTILAHKAAEEAGRMQGVTYDMDILACEKLPFDKETNSIIVPKLILKG